MSENTTGTKENGTGAGIDMAAFNADADATLKAFVDRHPELEGAAMVFSWMTGQHSDKAPAGIVKPARDRNSVTLLSVSKIAHQMSRMATLTLETAIDASIEVVNALSERLKDRDDKKIILP